MKRKAFLIAGTIFIILVLGGVLFFIWGNSEKQSGKTVSLKGTWLVYQHGEDLSREEFMVFSNDNISYYRKGNAAPIVSSKYSIKDSELNAPDIDKTFSVHIISDNNIELTEPNTVVWRLLLVGDPDIDKTKIIPEKVEGIYDVKVVGEESRYNETMTFKNSHLSFIQNGKETISSNYSVTGDGLLHLTTIKRDYYVYANGRNLFFIGVNDNGIWELYKIE